MPLYYFKCTDVDCPGTGRQLVTKAAYLIGTLGRSTLPCAVCGKPMERDPRPASSRVTETLDNGVMSRRVERPADAERLYKERARADNERFKDPKL